MLLQKNLQAFYCNSSHSHIIFATYLKPAVVAQNEN